MADLSLEQEHPKVAVGWTARDQSGEKDVRFQVLYCGICHLDLHLLKNEWGNSKYRLVPGHEIVGVVTEAGNKVAKFKVGDKVVLGVLLVRATPVIIATTTLRTIAPERNSPEVTKEI